MKIFKQPFSIFIVNLERDVEKNKHIRERCEKIDLPVEILKAVDGLRLNQSEIDLVYSKEDTVKVIGRELSASEIGCALSHKKIYQRIVDEEVPVALVLEDDVEFNKPLLDVLGEVESLPSDWELILLGHHRESSRSDETRASCWGATTITSSCKLVRPCELAYGTYGYLVNQKGARKLLAELELIKKPIDHYTGDSLYVNLYAVSPPAVGINEALSEQFNSMSGRQKLQAEQATFIQKNCCSWYKRVAIYLGIYYLLNSLLVRAKGFLNRVSPLREYR